MSEPEFSKNFELNDKTEFIEAAIQKCRSQAELARRLQDLAGVECYPQKINEWRKRGVIPPYWVRHMAKILKVSRKVIDPLLYD